MNEQEQMMQIISAISEKTGESPEKVVAMLQEIMQTEGREGVKSFIDKMLNPEAEMFRKGGKMEAAVNKFQRGGLLSRRQGLRGRNMRSAAQNAMLSIVPQPKANIDMGLVKNPEQALRLKAQSADGMRQRTVYDNLEYTGTPAQQYDQMMSDKMTTRVPMAEVGTQEDPREASLREAPWRANWGMDHDAMFMGDTGEPIVFNHGQQASTESNTRRKPIIGNYDSNGNWRLFVQDKGKGGKINKCQEGEKFGDDGIKRVGVYFDDKTGHREFADSRGRYMRTTFPNDTIWSYNDYGTDRTVYTTPNGRVGYIDDIYGNRDTLSSEEMKRVVDAIEARMKHFTKDERRNYVINRYGDEMLMPENKSSKDKKKK